MISHLEEVLEEARAFARTAAEAMGDTAVQCVRAQMLGGYGHAIRDSGDLMRDVGWHARDETSVDVGNTLPYAVYVHGGARGQPARPYLADGILGNAGALEEAARSADNA